MSAAALSDAKIVDSWRSNADACYCPADWRSNADVVCSRILRQARVDSRSAPKCLTTLRTRVAEISIPFPLIAAGEVHVASSLAAILIAAVPLIGAVLAVRFDHAERPTRTRAIGLGIGFAGVIALVGVDIAGRSSELLGAGAILIAAVGYAIGPMVVKHRLGGLDPRVMMGASLLVAMMILTPFAAVDVPSRAPTIGAWASVAGLGVFCTALAFVVFAVLIREAGTSRATVITYVNPVVAVVLGVTLEGERPGAGAIAGLLLILAGSWLSTGGRLPPWRRSSAPSEPGLTRA